MSRHRHNRRNKGSLHLVTGRISNRRTGVPFKSVYHHDEDRNMDIRRLTKSRHRTRSSTRTLNHTRFLYSEPTSASQRRVRSNFTGRPRRTIGTKPRLTSITRHLNTIVGGMSTIGTITRTRGRATNSSNKGRQNGGLHGRTRSPLRYILILLNHTLSNILQSAISTKCHGRIIMRITSHVTSSSLRLTHLNRDTLNKFRYLSLNGIHLNKVIRSGSRPQCTIKCYHSILLTTGMLGRRPHILFMFARSIFLLLPNETNVFRLIRANVFRLIRADSPCDREVPSLFVRIGVLLRGDVTRYLFSTLLADYPLRV